MKIVICDDDIQICFYMEKIVLEYAADHNYRVETEVLNSGAQLKEYLDSGEHMDMLYLDIEMPGPSGIFLGRYIREEIKNLLLHIVYISSHEKYAMELFAVSPLHFLVKPLEKSKICFTLERAFYLLGHGSQMFSYQKGHDTMRRPVNEILYFMSQGREVEMCTFHDRECFYASLTSIYGQLQEYRFIYCHQSYLVHYNHIARISSREIEMVNGHVIPVSQGKWPAVKALQIQFAREDFQFEL